MTTAAKQDKSLVDRAAALSRGAETVLADLGLPDRFESLGRTIRIGSTSFGLALLPDIDIGVLCPTLDAGAIWEALRPLAEHPHIKRLCLTDERGEFNSTGAWRDEGIYVGVQYYHDGTNGGDHWRLDCWFFPADAPRPEIPMRERLLAASAEDRLTILRLKDAAMRDGRYGPNCELHGIDIYDAVLDRGIRTYEKLVS